MTPLILEHKPPSSWDDEALHSFPALVRFLRAIRIHLCGEILTWLEEPGTPEEFREADHKSRLWQLFATCHLEGGRLELAVIFIRALAQLHTPFVLLLPADTPNTKKLARKCWRQFCANKERNR